MKRYEKLASEIAQSIQKGVLKIGDRLPSVRETSASQSVSPSTVFQAYYLLEAKGLITARERSGYFVSAGSAFKDEDDIKPETYPGHSQAAEVDVSKLVFEIIEGVRSRNVIPLGSAFPSPMLFPLDQLAKSMAASIKAMDPWTTVKDISPGDHVLRRQIALRYLTDGITVPVEEIVITSGALEALNLCLAAVTEPGDAVLVESPVFYAALQALEHRKLRAVEIPVHPQHGVDLDALAQAIAIHQPKVCWVMTNFQNPTGSLMSQERKQQLVTLLTEHGIPLIEDDVYGELYFSDHKPLPAKVYDKEGMVMHCSSFSKSLAPGYRVGWVAPGRFAKRIERIKLTTSIATSVPAQQAIAHYLTKGGYDRHLRGLRHTLLIQQIRFMEALKQHFPEDIRLCKPQGGYFVWVRLPEHMNGLEVYRAALAENISIGPGPMFSAQQGFRNYVRLNYGHDPISSEQALAGLGKIIHSLKQQ